MCVSLRVCVSVCHTQVKIWTCKNYSIQHLNRIKEEVVDNILVVILHPLYFPKNKISLIFIISKLHFVNTFML